MAKTAIVSSERDAFVQLARTKSGTLFRKEILRTGTFAHPNKAGEKLVIDDATLAKLVENFESGVCDIVQVPVVGGDNQHTEDPERNAGEVIALEIEGDKLYGVIDARSEKYAAEIGKTLLGASSAYATDYVDTNTGEHVGPTLLHVAITNRPHITGLEPFRELVAASADQSLDDVVEFTAVTEPKEEPHMATKEELIAQLKALGDDGIDVEKLQADLAAATAAPEKSEPDPVLTALSAALANAGIVKLSADKEPTPEELVTGVQTLHQANKVMASRLDSLEEKDAANEVDKLVRTGFVLPAQRDAMVKLSRENPEIFKSMIPDAPIVKVEAEQGADLPGDRETVALSGDKAETEVDRYIALVGGKKES